MQHERQHERERDLPNAGNKVLAFINLGPSSRATHPSMLQPANEQSSAHALLYFWRGDMLPTVFWVFCACPLAAGSFRRKRRATIRFFWFSRIIGGVIYRAASTSIPIRKQRWAAQLGCCRSHPRSVVPSRNDILRRRRHVDSSSMVPGFLSQILYPTRECPQRLRGC